MIKVIECVNDFDKSVWYMATATKKDRHATGNTLTNALKNLRNVLRDKKNDYKKTLR